MCECRQPAGMGLLVVLCVMVVVVGTLWPGRLVAQAGSGSQEAEEAPRIAGLEMECDLEQCENPIQVDKLLDLAGLYPGRRLEEQVLEIARTRLLKTGLFTTVSFERAEAATGGVRLTVNAQGAVRIRDIEFLGLKPPPFRSELRKLLVYRTGEAYEGRLTKRDTQLESLEAEFEKEGYFGTQIEMEVRTVGADRKLVDIFFEIEKKGQRLEICDIGLRGVRALSYPEARRQLLSDLPLFSSRIELFPPRFTTGAFEAGQAALIETYREMGYFQARIVEEAARKDTDKGCVTLLVDVEEGPRWKLQFRGNEAVDEVALTDELPFLESGYVDREEIERAEQAIRQLYETRGYPFASVEGREERDDRLNRRLIFEIDEGKRYEIEEVVFRGNRALDDETLAEGLGTRPFQLFEAGGFLQTAQLLGDIRRIEEKYNERGYLRAEVWKYEVELAPEEGEIRVHLHVREGERTVAQEVRFEGVRSLSGARLRRKVNVETGDPVVPVQVKADDSRIIQLYSSVGYPLAKATTQCRTLDGRVVGCEPPRRRPACVATTVESIRERCEWKKKGQRLECVRVDRSEAEDCGWQGGFEGANRIRVVHQIEEGPFVSAGEFLVQGNFRTQDAVIRRELPLETGDIFDVRKILQGQSNLRSLGIFNSVSVEAIGLDEAAAESREHEAALLINVEESTNRFFEFRFGFEGRDLLGDQRKLLTTADVEYSDQNLFGRALQFKPHVFGAVDVLQIGEMIQATAAQGTPGTSLDYLVGAELVLRHPRFLKGALGVDKLFLTVTPFYLIDLLGVANDQLLLEEWGLRMEVRKQLSEVLERLYVSFGLEGKQTATAPLNGPRLDGERIFSPRRTTGKLIPEVTLDRRDSPLNPTKGFFLKFAPEYVTGDALSPEINTFEDSYFRLTFNGDVFTPLWGGLVLGQSLRLGQAIPVAGRPTRVPADERYFLGGAGSLRGFPNNSLGPTLNDRPTGGEFLMNYVLELRYPLIPGIDLQGATFLDTGLLVDCFEDDNPQVRTGCYKDAFGGRGEALDNIRTAAGLGIRYVIGGQIPLLFDWGMALDRKQGEGFGSLHFHLGYTF